MFISCYGQTDTHLVVSFPGHLDKLTPES